MFLSTSNGQWENKVVAKDRSCSQSWHRDSWIFSFSVFIVSHVACWKWKLKGDKVFPFAFSPSLYMQRSLMVKGNLIRICTSFQWLNFCVWCQMQIHLLDFFNQFILENTVLIANWKLSSPAEGDCLPYGGNWIIQWHWNKARLAFLFLLMKQVVWQGIHPRHIICLDRAECFWSWSRTWWLYKHRVLAGHCSLLKAQSPLGICNWSWLQLLSP